MPTGATIPWVLQLARFDKWPIRFLIVVSMALKLVGVSVLSPALELFVAQKKALLSNTKRKELFFL